MTSGADPAAQPLSLLFCGRFVCRLAVDPDPFDEPYGLRGKTFWLPGEPPFDRTIRTAPGDGFVRPFCPPVGVGIVGMVPAYPAFADLVGATVVLQPDDAGYGPCFEEWNGLNGTFNDTPISHVDLSLGEPAMPLLRRASRERMLRGSFAPTGFMDLAKDLERLSPADRSLELDPRCRSLAAETIRVPQNKSVLEARARAAGPEGTPPQAFAAACYYACELDSPPAVQDRFRRGTPRVDPDAPWRLCFAFSRWDNDSLSGVIVGRLTIPLLP